MPSFRARLQNLSRPYRYPLERLLYCLSSSAYADRFALKGAMLAMSWFTDPYRAVRDLDLLGFRRSKADAMVATFKEIPAAEIADGVEFDLEAVRVDQIREELEYGGRRLRTTGVDQWCPYRSDG